MVCHRLHIPFSGNLTNCGIDEGKTARPEKAMIAAEDPQAAYFDLALADRGHGRVADDPKLKIDA